MSLVLGYGRGQRLTYDEEADEWSGDSLALVDELQRRLELHGYRLEMGVSRDYDPDPVHTMGLNAIRLLRLLGVEAEIIKDEREFEPPEGVIF